jgi:hypothetical protein
MAGFLANGMRSASVFFDEPFCADTNSRIVNTGAAHIKIVSVSLLLVSIGNGALEHLVDHRCGTFSRELQDALNILLITIPSQFESSGEKTRFHITHSG